MSLGGGNQNEAFAGMNPIDAAKLAIEIQNAQVLPPDQAARNRTQNAQDALSIFPIIGNVISAKDAYEGAGEAANAYSRGDYRDAAISGGLSALSGLGALAGLPVGKLADDAVKGASSRTNVFVPAEGHTSAPKARETFDSLVDDAGFDKANRKTYRETGLFFGPDGAVRREIPDDYTVKGLPAAGEDRLLSDVIDHPDLFAAYPDLANAPVEITPRDLSFSNVLARTDPDTGALQIQEGLSDKEVRTQLSKLLQYKINETSPFAQPGRESAKNVETDIKAALTNAQAAIDEGILSPDSGARYMQSLTDALEGSSDIPRKGKREYFTKRSAGKRDVKNVKRRAYNDETGYPYDSRSPIPVSELFSAPRRDTTPDEMANFVNQWTLYGSGRVKER